MASINSIVFFSSLIPYFILFTSSSCQRRLLVTAKAETEGLFVFGSSLVDNGNNIFVPNAISRANYRPYGIDFALGPTGRYTNGKNVIDELGELLKLPSFIPASENPLTGVSSIVHGVNYASGGSGILDETGTILLGKRVITLNQQIKKFNEVTLREIKNQLGSSPPVSSYLFIMGTGGNDYLLNYFLSIKSVTVPVEAFTDNLTENFSTQLQKLYSFGARKFVLISVYPLGCIPFVKMNTLLFQGSINKLNHAAHLFNSKVRVMVDHLKPKLPGSYLVYVDSYKIILDIINDPVPKGFKDTTNPCCKVPTIFQGGNGILCKRNGSICNDRSSYVFFDGVHPTEAVNSIIAHKAYTSNLHSEVYPINVQQLAKLQVESD